MNDQAQTQQPSSLVMIRALGGVGAACALLIAFTYQTTLPIITAKKEAYLKKAVYRVLPGAVTSKSFGFEDGRIFEVQEGAEAAEWVHAGYNDAGELVGVALTAGAQGFQDVIKILYGYAPDSQTVVGFQVLESRETPGLGDKIEKDARFLENFKALDVTLNQAGEPVNPIEMVKPGAKTNPWQIDAISGATISSEAIGAMLKDHTARQLPVVRDHLTLLREKKP